jgi:integrase
MTIADFDFIERRITIHDAKRGGDRIVPFFPELINPIQEVIAGRAAHELLLPELANDPSSTLRSKLERDLRKSNIRIWPRIWHSMRATRETELAEQFGLKAASVWIGNSEAVAVQSYLLVPPELFAQATQG